MPHKNEIEELHQKLEEIRAEVLEKNGKDFWDKLSSITPLITGVLIAGIGTIATLVYNSHQMWIQRQEKAYENSRLESESKNQQILQKVDILDKNMKYLNSADPRERELGYFSFSLVGFESEALKIIAINKDFSGGYNFALNLAKTSSNEKIWSQANKTLQTLQTAEVQTQQTVEIHTIPGSVQKAPSGVKGFDFNGVLSLAEAQKLKNAGYDFCVRMIPRMAKSISNDLSYAEALNILDAGLALTVAQHVPLEGWAPNANLGTVMGNYAANYSSQIGLPKGMNIWCDLEGVAPSTPPADVIDYCQAWYNAVRKQGYVPGLYVGFGCGLSGKQLNELSFQHFWRGVYNAPEVGIRGFQLLQGAEVRTSDLPIDLNTTQNDNLGEGVLWIKK